MGKIEYKYVISWYFPEFLFFWKFRVTIHSAGFSFHINKLTNEIFYKLFYCLLSDIIVEKDLT